MKSSLVILMFIVTISVNAQYRVDEKYYEQSTIRKHLSQPEAIIKTNLEYLQMRFNNDRERYEFDLISMDSVCLCMNKKGEFFFHYKKSTNPKTWYTIAIPTIEYAEKHKGVEPKEVENRTPDSIVVISFSSFENLISSSGVDLVWQETIQTKDTTFALEFFESYLCYDPFCGSKHGHMNYTSHSVFNRDIGIVFINSSLFYIPDKLISLERMIGMLEQLNVNSYIIDAYRSAARKAIRN